MGSCNYWGVVIPFASWLLLICYSLYVRGCNELYAEGWNQARQQRKEQLIEFGQRPLYVVFNQLYTELGDSGNAMSIVENLMTLQAQIPRSGGAPVLHSRLKLPVNVNESEFSKRIAAIFVNLVSTLSSITSPLLSHYPLNVRLFIDVPISADEVELIWDNVLGSKDKLASWELIDASKSSIFLDGWLDNSNNDNHVLWCISLHLFELPTPKNAEAMSI